MKKRLASLMLAMMLCPLAISAEDLKVTMSLDSAHTVLEAAGATKDLYAYHFPWTSRFIEVRVQDSETWEQSEERTASELKKVSGKRGYSVFYTLKDKTRLELVLAVDGESKVIHAIRVGEPAVEYKDKLGWIEAAKEGKLSVHTTFNPKR